MKNMFKSIRHFLIPINYVWYNYFSSISVMKPKQKGELILRNKQLKDFLELEADLYNLPKNK
tara:strand:+ start:3802 stop:3987 length:186 start_codon:yes stop_codon:yes gene_type:complete